jgi:hypothetical protein
MSWRRRHVWSITAATRSTCETKRKVPHTNKGWVGRDLNPLPMAAVSWYACGTNHAAHRFFTSQECSRVPKVVGRGRASPQVDRQRTCQSPSQSAEDVPENCAGPHVGAGCSGASLRFSCPGTGEKQNTFGQIEFGLVGVRTHCLKPIVAIVNTHHCTDWFPHTSWLAHGS